MSDGGWDDDDFTPPAPTKAANDKWAGEDDDDVKDSWDAEDEEKDKSGDDGSVKAVQRKKKKPLAERIAEKEAARIVAEKQEKEENKILTKEERYAEAERLKKIQEEADLKLAREAFGVSDVAEAAGIDAMFPDSEDDFMIFKKALKQKIKLFGSSKHYGAFLDKFIQDLLIDCDLEDLRKISTNASSMFHEKQRQQKELDKKKKKKNKGMVKAERDSDFGNLAAAGQGDYDDNFYEEDFI